MPLNYQTLKRHIEILKNEPEYVLNQLLPIARYWLNKLISYYSVHSITLNKLFFVLTLKCNMRCKMCSLWGKKGICKSFPKELLDEELNIDELKKVIDSIGYYSPSIIFFGGEPLLYEGWYELGKYIKKKRLRVNLPTNGYNVVENANKIVEIFDNIDFSLDGIGEIHDTIRGIKGAFDKALIGMREINKIKKEKNLIKPYINVISTISDDNYNHMIDLVDFLDNQNIEINLLNFQHTEFAKDKVVEKHNEFLKRNFNQEVKFWYGAINNNLNIDVEVLITQINKINERKLKNIKFLEFEPEFEPDEIRKYYNRDDRIPPVEIKNKCLAPFFECMILPNGDVWLCPDYVIGNIKEANFNNIWNNDRAKRYREVLIKNKRLPICGSCYYVYM